MGYFFLSGISLAGLGVVYWHRFAVMQRRTWTQRLLDKLHIKRSEAPVETEQTTMVLLTPEQQEMLKESLMSADAYFECGDLDEAERLYIKVLSLDEHNEEANSRLGLIYLKKGLPKKAEAIFRALMARTGENEVLLSNLAFALFLQHNLDEACRYYEAAIALDGSRSSRHANLAQVYRELGRYDDAIRSLQKTLSLDPQHNEYRLLLAETYCDAGMLDLAQTIARNILKHEDGKSPLRRAARVLIKRLENKTAEPPAVSSSLDATATNSTATNKTATNKND